MIHAVVKWFVAMVLEVAVEEVDFQLEAGEEVVEEALMTEAAGEEVAEEAAMTEVAGEEEDFLVAAEEATGTREDVVEVGEVPVKIDLAKMLEITEGPVIGLKSFLIYAANNYFYKIMIKYVLDFYNMFKFYWDIW